MTPPQHLCAAALPLLTLHTAGALGALALTATSRGIRPKPPQCEIPAPDTHPRPTP
ncbi:MULTISPECIES: hypothetical protein [Kitasatospora]|uniref:hypothetical protein n=1 Tax=Kitasatospora TaxID=2063 RepID=UPI000CA87E65|nr:hypothetical protein [Kitasatospora sp. GP30]MDH6138969.1 hypothetical protein [Kitasatospora sp. GP30]